MRRSLAILATLAVLAAGTVPIHSAAAQERVRVGVLNCVVEGGSGFIFGSSKRLGCTYRPAGGAAPERYTGTINKFGIDIGATSVSEIAWGVLAPTGQPSIGSLAGTYVGVSAEATAGAGLGANALIGGFGRSIVLNPLSVQAQTGVNVAAGIAELRLEEAEPAG